MPRLESTLRYKIFRWSHSLLFSTFRSHLVEVSGKHHCHVFLWAELLGLCLRSPFTQCKICMPPWPRRTIFTPVMDYRKYMYCTKCSWVRQSHQLNSFLISRYQSLLTRNTFSFNQKSISKLVFMFPVAQEPIQRSTFSTFLAQTLYYSLY